MLNYRELIKTIVPTWLRKGLAEKLLYTLALYFDALIELTEAAVKIRFPGQYGAEPLPYHSRERRIRQGIGEPDDVFAGRLTTFLETHKDRGGPYQLLEQIHAHYKYSPDGPFPVHLVYTSGARYDMTPEGAVTRAASSFTSGLSSDDWAHWWLVYEWPSTVNADGLWDDAGVWDDGGVWDSDLPAATITDLRLIPTEWNNAYCQGTIVLLSPGQALWDVPIELWDESPTGTWDEGTGSVLVQVEIE